MTHMPTIHSNMLLKGRYRLKRIKADNGMIIHTSPWINNLITDAGKRTYINSNNNIDLTCAVGTGNSTPAASDTALDHLKYRVGAAAVTASPGVFTEEGGTLKSTYQFRFYPGQAVGNISELGIYLGLPGYPDFTLFSRALVRDSNNNPTTITVLSDEYLDVYWEFTLTIAGRTTGTFLLDNKGNASNVDWILKPAATHWWNAHYGSGYLSQPRIHSSYSYLANDVISEPSRNEENPASSNGWAEPNYGTALPYVDGSFYREYEYVWLLDRANFSNINCFRLYIGTGYLWLYLPNGGFEKTGMDTLTLRFRLSVA